MNTNAQQVQEPRRVGLVGVGLMGSGIAQNIVKHGHKLTILDHPGNQPVGALLAAGATAVSDVTALAAEVDVLILCVTGTPQVEAVMLGEKGALTSLRSGTVVIDCSTAVPDSTTKVAQAVQAKGGKFLDAPMTRTAKEAAEGRLNLLVGGDAEVLASCLPLLRCFAENITHVGGIGAGHAMKLLHNFVSLGTVALLCEAAACAERAGVAPDVFVDVLAKGGGNGVALERVKPKLLTGSTDSLKFSMANAKKDLGYYNDMAQQSSASHGIAQAVEKLLTHGIDTFGPDRMVLDLVEALKK
ncbi:3-hydroxyisobutyrate dehydrogenase-like beta-hydroxyacid dehydrogenase [Variovorax boronicumulans]|uniref:3-hydroxyisobutyrate dehydrogenase-like beta-hydroxyacid dehydrogenase n=1 Tax=Variovorax boronicumulans TaxID=436515 RepID=A0AAW8D3Y0_9BURK|nr:NAD(P)-dependent oxidoreductase [Variovorax boronicumulans]MDP9897444.1 3-hydroxyisobutyrate dehydrogenase-like beta-hydroxyacid dehydrogenase [Variovorax boronicumulans]MDQ0057483.1 3-hydroxyisobutyrate dehydrogenase-like beta-hydroxyacid dehydrogenase [Variovorax boronicumulans]